MGIHKIKISDKMIEFLGFELLSGKITISLLQGGIVIFPGTNENKKPHHYEVALDADKKVYDELLIQILKSRGVRHEMRFICINNNHYTEIRPHPIQS